MRLAWRGFASDEVRKLADASADREKHQRGARLSMARPAIFLKSWKWRFRSREDTPLDIGTLASRRGLLELSHSGFSTATVSTTGSELRGECASDTGYPPSRFVHEVQIQHDGSPFRRAPS